MWGLVWGGADCFVEGVFGSALDNVFMGIFGDEQLVRVGEEVAVDVEFNPADCEWNIILFKMLMSLGIFSPVQKGNRCGSNILNETILTFLNLNPQKCIYLLA